MILKTESKQCQPPRPHPRGLRFTERRTTAARRGGIELGESTVERVGHRWPLVMRRSPAGAPRLAARLPGARLLGAADLAAVLAPPGAASVDRCPRPPAHRQDSPPVKAPPIMVVDRCPRPSAHRQGECSLGTRSTGHGRRITSRVRSSAADPRTSGPESTRGGMRQERRARGGATCGPPRWRDRGRADRLPRWRDRGRADRLAPLGRIRAD